MSQITYPLGMPKDLMKEVKDAAKETGLSTADVMRQAIKFGVPKVRQALSTEEDFAEAAAALIHMRRRAARVEEYFGCRRSEDR